VEGINSCSVVCFVEGNPCRLDCVIQEGLVGRGLEGCVTVWWGFFVEGYAVSEGGAGDDGACMVHSEGVGCLF
jgi:hypothetical protein